MSNRQIDVQIMGQSYILGCPVGGEESLLTAVRKVDEAMCKIRDAGKIKARDRIAVLAALNLAFEQTDAETSTETETPTDSQPAAQETTQASDKARLELLLKKLDQALHQDGQLI